MFTDTKPHTIRKRMECCIVTDRACHSWDALVVCTTPDMSDIWDDLASL